MSGFFLCSWGMNRSAGQTNRLNREAVLGRFFVPRFDSFPMNPEKKDIHSLIEFILKYINTPYIVVCKIKIIMISK